MTLNVPAASTPAPSGAVTNAGSPGAVDFDKFSAGRVGKRGDTRVAQIAAGADTAAEAGFALWGAAIVGGALLAMHELEQEPDGTRRYERQMALAKDCAQQLTDGLKNLKSALAFVNVHIDVPSMASIQKQVMSLYEGAKRNGGNVRQAADRFARQLTGQGGGASTIPVAAQATTQAGAGAPTATPTAPATTAGTPTTARRPALNTDQSTQAMLAQSNVPLQRINAGVQAFYQQAAGGQAARQRGALAQPLKQVTDARAGLNKAVLAANKLVANSSAQARPSFEAGLKNLRQARDAIDAWLPQANAFAAGRNAPNGKRVAQPSLPATPTFAATPANVSAKDVAANWIKARNAAGNTPVQSAQAAQQTSAAQPSATVTNQKPSPAAAAPQVKVVDKFPPSVKRVAPVWVNPVTGEASATAKMGKGWVKAQVGVPTSLAINPVGSGTQNVYDNRKQTIILQMPPDPNNKGKGPNWIALLGALGGLATGGSLIWSNIASELDRGTKNGEQAWLDTLTTRFAPFRVPPRYANAEAKAQGLVDMWKSYLEQVPGLIEKNSVSESKSEIASVKKEFAAHAAEFLQGLASDRDALKSQPEAEKQILLKGMAQKQLPDFSSSVNGTQQRPTKLMTVLIAKLNKSVASNDAPSIFSRPIAAGKPSSRVPAGGAAAEAQTRAVAQAQVNKVLDKRLVEEGLRAAPTTPASPGTTPAAQPSPAVPAPDAAAAQAQAAQKQDETKALKTVADAVKRANLRSPPNTAALSTMRFTLDMFIDKSQWGDTLAIQDAFARAQSIQKACQAAERGAAKELTRRQVTPGPGKSVTAVLEELNTLMRAANERAPSVEPSTKPGNAPAGAGPSPQPTPSLGGNKTPPPVLKPSTVR